MKIIHQVMPIIYILCSTFLIADGDIVQKPNDPMFDEQWGLNNTDYGFDIGILKAWELTKGNKNIAIAIIGTGADYNHPDLVKNMWVNPNEIPGNGIDDDKNGYIDDVHGINAIDGSGDPMDEHGHETFAAGIIGAEVNNGIGIAGIMHDVSIIACKFIDSRGGGTTEDAIKCFEYIADLAESGKAGVEIIATNNAWGGGGSAEKLKNAIERHKNLGILTVTTAGNDATDLDEFPVYPASYDLANIIVVGKIEPNGSHKHSGSYGANTVHLAAPGSRLISTWINAGYQTIDGSQSTAFVSGILGLIKSHNPSLSAAQLKHRLLAGVMPMPYPEDYNKFISSGYCSAIGSLSWNKNKL